MLRTLSKWLKRRTQKDKKLSKAFTQIIGRSPYNIQLYALAMKHTSVANENKRGFKESNERLEYLGDAVLGAVVAEYLFKRYPFKDEGFLTEIRSRIVNREALNHLAIKIGLSQLVEFEGKKRGGLNYKSIYGDAMEAFIGALYLDMGFHFCKRYIIKKLLIQHYDLNEIVDTTTNFKSLLIEWSQKNNKEVQFETFRMEGRKHARQFNVKLQIDGTLIAEGKGMSKKKAEQDAARRASQKLNLID